MERRLVLAPDETGRAHTVETAAFLQWVRQLPSDGALACDTETSGLEWAAETRLVQFGNSDGGYAIDVRGPEGRALVQQVLDTFAGTIVFYNACFDIHRLSQIGVDPEYMWPRSVDAHVLAHIVQPDRLSFKLKILGQMVLGIANTEQKEMEAAMAKHGWGYDNIPLLVQAAYGVQDTVLTHKLFTLFRSQITDREWTEVVPREMDVRWAMAEVFNRGIRLDHEYAQQLNERWSSRIDELTTQMMTYPLEDRVCGGCKGTGKTPTGRDHKACAGVGIIRGEFLDNPNADAQIARALYIDGWKPKLFSEKTRKPVLDKDVLKELDGQFSLIPLLREYKRLNKWRSSYVLSCLREVDPEGYVHAAYNTLGAKTSRMSCSNPPLQQLPKGGGGEVRRLFIASPGNVIASVDYNAVEPRLSGALSGEPKLIQAFADGVDIYTQFGEPLGIERPQAKIFFLSTLYGATAKRHAEVFGWGEAFAQQQLDEFWMFYPTLAKWNRGVIRKCRRGEEIHTQWGRTLRPHAPYAGPNAVIQGTAAEVMKDGLMRLWGAGLLKYVCAVVHDEVVLDVPAEKAEDMANQVAGLLRDDSFAIPLLAEASVYGPSWGDGYAA